jgi:predicted alpha/beta superfamily hydrolase
MDAGVDAGVDAGADVGADAGMPDAGATLLRIHYPAGSHTITVRGSAGGLSWTSGAATTRSSGDVYTRVISGAAEWKPLLDGATWARGPNYRVAAGQTVDVWPHFTTVKGQVVTLIASFHSTILNDDRPIYAYLPPSYDENTEATFPVVYMHDGQNLWAALPQLAAGATWNVDTTFDIASESGTCSGWAGLDFCTGDSDCDAGRCETFPEAIVIGAANTPQRIYEYTPTTDPTTPGGGGADLYLRMLVEELKPIVDGMLRTRPDVASTAMAGSSLGGLVTAYAGVTKPRVFGRLAELSPSSGWNGGVIITDVLGSLPAPDRPLFVYVDSASGAADDEVDTRALAAAYADAGIPLRYVVQDGGMHNETYWGQRFPGAMQLVLGER